jgi:DNA-binding transcriptional regulator YiaG
MKNKKLVSARDKLGLSPTQMAKAMGVSYDTYKDWQSGRRSMSNCSHRCLELLLLYPKTAKRLSKQ